MVHYYCTRFPISIIFLSTAVRHGQKWPPMAYTDPKESGLNKVDTPIRKLTSKLNTVGTTLRQHLIGGIKNCVSKNPSE